MPKRSFRNRKSKRKSFVEFQQVVPDCLVEAYDFDDYQMNPEHKKIALIFNLQVATREGSKNDVKRLKVSLENHLKFDVKIFEDLTKDQVFGELKTCK